MNNDLKFFPDLSNDDQEQKTLILYDYPRRFISHNNENRLHNLLWVNDKVTGKQGWWEAWKENGVKVHEFLQEKRKKFPNAFLSQYLVAIRLAYDSVTTRTSDYKTPFSDRIQAIGLMVRYTMIETSLNSMAEKTPLDMLPILVKNKIWDESQALLYAGRTPEKQKRADAIIAITRSYLEDEINIEHDRIDTLPDEATKQFIALIKTNAGQNSETASKIIRNTYIRQENTNEVIQVCIDLLKKADSRRSGIQAIEGLSTREFFTEDHAKQILDISLKGWSNYDLAPLLLATVPKLHKDDIIFWVNKLEYGYDIYLPSEEKNQLYVAIVARLSKLGQNNLGQRIAIDHLSDYWYFAALSLIAQNEEGLQNKILQENILNAVSQKRWMDTTEKTENGLYTLYKTPKSGFKEVNIIDSDIPYKAMIHILPMLGESDLFHQATWVILDKWYVKDGAWVIPQIAKKLSVKQKEVFFENILKILAQEDRQNTFLIHRQRALTQLANYIPDTLIDEALTICENMLPKVISNLGKLSKNFENVANKPLAGEGGWTAGDFTDYISHSFDYEDLKNITNVIYTLVGRSKDDRFIKKIVPVFNRFPNNQAKIEALTSLCPKLPIEEFTLCVQLARDFKGGYKKREIDSDALQISSIALARLATQADIQQREKLIDEAVEVAHKISGSFIQRKGESLMTISQILKKYVPEDIIRKWLVEALESGQKIDDQFEQVTTLVEIIPLTSFNHQQHTILPLLDLVNKNGNYPRRYKESIGETMVQEDREQVLLKLIPILLNHGYQKEFRSLSDDLDMMSEDLQKKVLQIYKTAKPLKHPQDIIAKARQILKLPIEAKAQQDLSFSEVLDMTNLEEKQEGLNELATQIKLLSDLSRKTAYKEIQKLIPKLYAVGGNKLMDEVYDVVLKVGKWWE